WELRGMVPPVASHLGHAYILAGRIADALPLLERAVEQSASVLRLVYLAEGYLRAGRADDAAHTAGRALERARHHKERANEAWALRLLGEIVAHADPPDIEHARTHYQEALALAEELGMRPLVAHCHLGLGTLYQKIGRGEQAQAELTTAAEMYRSMEMTFWSEKAEAAATGAH